MSEDTGLGLADAIDQLREQLLEARDRAEEAELQFPIRSVTVELQLVAARKGEGKAGFKVPVIDFELGAGASLSRETTHKVLIEFGEPVDDQGVPVRVNRVSRKPLD